MSAKVTGCLGLRTTSVRSLRRKEDQIPQNLYPLGLTSPIRPPIDKKGFACIRGNLLFNSFFNLNWLSNHTGTPLAYSLSYQLYADLSKKKVLWELDRNPANLISRVFKREDGVRLPLPKEVGGPFYD
jgi:hypothetical protein